MKVLIVLLAVFAANSIAILTCKEVKVIEDFSMKEYAATYYEYKMFSNLQSVAPFLFGRCARQKYELVEGEDDKLFITNVQLEANGTYSTQTGYAVYKNPAKKNGDIVVTMVVAGVAVPLNYKILYFYHGKFIIVFNCLLGLNSGWILTTDIYPDAATVALIDAAVISTYPQGGPDASEYKLSSKEGCTYD